MNAIETTGMVSKPSPASVEPMVRVQGNRPFVQIVKWRKRGWDTIALFTQSVGPSQRRGKEGSTFCVCVNHFTQQSQWFWYAEWRYMSGLDLTFIGSGNAFAPGGLCWNGFLANGRYLFETPPSALMALHKVGADPNELDVIVISHHHGDHFLGLPFLLLHWKYKGRTKPVKIVGPKDTRALALNIAEQVFPGSIEESFPVDWIEVAPGQSLVVAGLDLDVHLVQHDRRLAECLGYACKIGSNKFGYTGDTIFCDGVKDLARSSDVLISECASRDQVIPVHMNLIDDMPNVRALMKPDAPLILTHIDTDVDTNGMKNTFIAEDFKTFRF